MFKKYRQLFIGILIGIILATALPVGAAVHQYMLKPASVKLVVDGTEYANKDLPILYLEPGYNYLPAAAFRDICAKIGIGFTYDSAKKEIQLNTKAAEATVKEDDNVSVSTPEKLTDITDFTTNENGEETFISGGVKYITSSSIYSILESKKTYRLLAFETGPYIYKTNDREKIIVDMPFKIYANNDGNKKICFDYDYYLNTILPLVQE